MLNPPQSFKIGGTDCTFTKIESECPVKYKGKGTCSLHSLSQQLFPDINVEESTSKLIVPAKFNAKGIEIFACPQNPKNGVFSIAAKSIESVELAPQRLTLGAETQLTISWNTLIAFDPKTLEVKLDGFTSIGRKATFFFPALLTVVLKLSVCSAFLMPSNPAYFLHMRVSGRKETFHEPSACEIGWPAPFFADFISNSCPGYPFSDGLTGSKHSVKASNRNRNIDLLHWRRIL